MENRWKTRFAVSKTCLTRLLGSATKGVRTAAIAAWTIGIRELKSLKERGAGAITMVSTTSLFRTSMIRNPFLNTADGSSLTSKPIWDKSIARLELKTRRGFALPQTTASTI